MPPSIGMDAIRQKLVQKDMPWGHRMAHVTDPFRNSWFIAT
jgi:uncharacterized glyoxalase superfamily protein PhnB